MTAPITWAKPELGELNDFVGRAIDPSNYPQEQFELFSVPIFPTKIPERVQGSEIGSTKQIVEAKDILICKINPRINRVWLVPAKNSYRQIASSEWIGFRSQIVEPRFATYYFRSPKFRELLCADVTGVGGSLTRAQPKRVATFELPLAPLPEQKRIADKLDATLARVDACRERLMRVR